MGGLVGEQLREFQGWGVVLESNASASFPDLQRLTRIELAVMLEVHFRCPAVRMMSQL